MTGTSERGRLCEGFETACRLEVSESALGYTFRSDGGLQFDGERPGPQWHAHGWMWKWQCRLRKGHVAWVVVYKRRWRLKGTNRTCHSRPLDDGICSSFVSIIVALRIIGVIDSPVGFHGRDEVLEALTEGAGSDRTVQRWVARAQGEAMSIQQAIRLVIIEEVEPRPVESLFRGGLSPPIAVASRRWHSPRSIFVLWNAYAMLLLASSKLAKPATYLLAEARRRCQSTKTPTSI